MKQGKTLQGLAKEIERRQESKRDFLADTTQIEMTPSGKIEMDEPRNEYGYVNRHRFDVSDYAHGQIASRLKIPKVYYDRMKGEAPELFSKNVNTWFGKEPEVRMIRTLDNSVRAFLSERYRTLDNFDLLESALPVIMENDCKIESCEVTEMRMYLKCLFPKIQDEVKKGDVVQAGIVISNSEIGAGSLKVEPLIYRLVCMNGMISNTSMKKYHVGRANGTSFEDIQELLRDETKAITDKAFWMQVQDVIRSSFNKDLFLGSVDKLREASEQKMTKDPIKVVEIIKKDNNFTDSQESNILRHLLKDGDLSKYGLANAVTRTSQDVGDYDVATDFERIGGRIIELSENDWSEVAVA